MSDKKLANANALKDQIQGYYSDRLEGLSLYFGASLPLHSLAQVNSQSQRVFSPMGADSTRSIAQKDRRQGLMCADVAGHTATTGPQMLTDGPRYWPTVSGSGPLHYCVNDAWGVPTASSFESLGHWPSRPENRLTVHVSYCIRPICGMCVKVIKSRDWSEVWTNLWIVNTRTDTVCQAPKMTHAAHNRARCIDLQWDVHTHTVFDSLCVSV